MFRVWAIEGVVPWKFVECWKPHDSTCINNQTAQILSVLPSSVVHGGGMATTVCLQSSERATSDYQSYKES